MPKILKDRLVLLDAIGIKGKDCLEVGVFEGDFAQEIVNREPRSLYLVDPWMSQSALDYHDINNHNQAVFDEIHQKVVERFKEYPHVAECRKTSYEAFRQISRDMEPDEMLDFVYIDGNHAYQHVLADLMLWSTVMRPGAFLCGHDYKSSFIGVQMAVDHFCQMTGHELVYETDDAPWRSFGIRIK